MKLPKTPLLALALIACPASQPEDKCAHLKLTEAETVQLDELRLVLNAKLTTMASDERELTEKLRDERSDAVLKAWFSYDTRLQIENRYYDDEGDIHTSYYEAEELLRAEFRNHPINVKSQAWGICRKKN